MIRMNRNFDKICCIQTENTPYRIETGTYQITFQKVNNFCSDIFQVSGNKVTIISDKVKYVLVEGMIWCKNQSSSELKAELHIRKNGENIVSARTYTPSILYSDLTDTISKTLIPVKKDDYFECVYYQNNACTLPYFNFCITAVF